MLDGLHGGQSNTRFVIANPRNVDRRAIAGVAK
jgi:hypothetical protein